MFHALITALGIFGFSVVGLSTLIHARAAVTSQTLLDGADVYATLAFGVSGAFVVSTSSGRRSLPTWAAVLAGIATGIGGGTIRDIIFLHAAPIWVKETWMAPLVLIAAVIGNELGRRPGKTLTLAIDLLDYLALAVTTVTAFYKAQAIAGPGATLAQLAPLSGILAFIAASGGGLCRDLVLGRRPAALSTTYGLLAVLGGVLAPNLMALQALPQIVCPVQVAIIFGAAVVSRHWRVPRR